MMGRWSGFLTVHLCMVTVRCTVISINSMDVNNCYEWSFVQSFSQQVVYLQ